MNVKIIFLIFNIIFLLYGTTYAIAEEVKRTDLVAVQGKTLTVVGHPIQVGELAPDFTALNRVSRPVSLEDYAGRVRIITAFPSIDTEVCSIQARRFNEEAGKLDGVQVLSVSMDMPVALDRFCGTHGIENLETLSDHKDADFALKYGFLIEELQQLARGTVIIDQDGVVRYVEYVPELLDQPDYERAIATARKLLN
jgi:thiol peroxidase